jgi:hypothetical protein
VTLVIDDLEFLGTNDALFHGLLSQGKARRARIVAHERRGLKHDVEGGHCRNGKSPASVTVRETWPNGGPESEKPPEPEGTSGLSRHNVRPAHGSVNPRRGSCQSFFRGSSEEF